MHKYWFHIGWFPVRSYSTIFLLAFILGLGFTIYVIKTEKKEKYIPAWLDLGPLLFFGGVIGARIWQVFFFDWAFYSKYPGQIIAVWNGGLSIQGGIVGAIITGWIFARIKKIPFWELADMAAPGILLGQSIGRDADFMNGSAYGSPTGSNFGILYPVGTLAREQYGNHPLWPAMLWEGQADILLFAILMMLKLKKWPTGWLFVYYMISYNIVRFFLEMLRGDSPRFLFNWDAAQWTAIPMVVAGIIAGVWLWFDERRRKKTASLDETAPMLD
ncbi:MAG: prolipoprotein diacylglyceryl transferase [Acidibacillus sp.]|nr:prolipoprotein diacylglyceryl transferase [Acidibacillus sp.]